MVRKCGYYISMIIIILMLLLTIIQDGCCVSSWIVVNTNPIRPSRIKQIQQIQQNQKIKQQRNLHKNNLLCFNLHNTYSKNSIHHDRHCRRRDGIVAFSSSSSSSLLYNTKTSSLKMMMMSNSDKSMHRSIITTKKLSNMALCMKKETTTMISSFNNNNNATTTTMLFEQQSSSSTMNMMNDQILIAKEIDIAFRNSQKEKAIFQQRSGAIVGPDLLLKPNYDTIIGPFGKWFDTLLLIVFRIQLEKYVIRNHPNPNTVQLPITNYPIWDYQGIIDITKYMNHQYMNRTLIQLTSQQTLVSLFPSWLPPQFNRMFATPFPILSAKLNAYTTYYAGTWLMGETSINNITIPTSSSTTKTNTNNTNTMIGTGINQGLLVKRCRFLEETNCASICVNSCKIPTQTFFNQYMGIPLLMEPNYTSYECQFSFGIIPSIDSELVATQTPCLQRCPTYGSLKEYHSTSTSNSKNLKINDPIINNNNSTMENDFMNNNNNSKNALSVTNDTVDDQCPSMIMMI